VRARRGAELPVDRITGIALSRSVLQRALHAGRLTLEYAEPGAPTGRGAWVLEDVPLVAEVQQVLVALTASAPRHPALPDLY
jgi:hypothetical protein